MTCLKRPLWAIFFLTLPVTSFPFFPPTLGGDALVRPLSLYPLILLLIFFILPATFKKPLPKTFLPLLFFAVAATISSLLSLLSGIEPALGISVSARILRGIFTLGIGGAIYLTVATLPDTPADLRFSMRWMYAGCALAMLWGSIQAITIIHFDYDFFMALRKIQTFISTRRLLSGRISGMTYEPHWFADQMILLVIPGTLAAILSARTIFQRLQRGALHPSKQKPIIESLLLAWAIILLPFTYSRSGLLNLLLILFPTIVPRAASLAIQRLRQRFSHSSSRRLPSLLTTAGLALCIGAALLIPIYLVGTKNTFFARIWQYWQRPDATLSGYFMQLGFDIRLTYAQAAYNTYEAHPLLGVGLGNFGFYLEEMLPEQPLPDEILRLITPEIGRERLVTAKNFYLRLLAETGILGAAIFIAFLIANLGNALYLWLSPDPEWKYWGLTGLIGLLAFGLSAFSFDSFVIPNMWVIVGQITAAARIAARQYSAATSESKITP